LHDGMGVRQAKADIGMGTPPMQRNRVHVV
jgi:hypothetical protein